MAENVQKNQDISTTGTDSSVQTKDGEITVARGSLAGVIIIALLGLADMIYLTRLHWIVGSVPGYQSFCNISAEYDCDAVAASPYSVLFGVPVSFWGVLAYIAIIVVAVWSLKPHFPRKAPEGAGLGILSVMAVGSLITAAILGYISHFLIQSFCVMCMLGYIINLGIAVCVVLALLKHGLNPLRALWNDISFLLANLKFTASLGAAAAVVLLITLVAYPVPSMPEEPEMKTETGGDEINPAIREDAPFKGPEDAKITIVEFTDYECPACRASQQRLEEMLAPFRGRYRIMHRHFPLDQSCNPSIPREFNRYSCSASRHAICAQQQGRFWEMNELIFSSRRPLTDDHLRFLAEQAGLNLDEMEECLESGTPEEYLARDIKDGIELEIRGTPSLFIGGNVIVGLPRPEQINAVLSTTLGKD